MATIDVYNMKREKVGSVELADEVFATEVKEHLFYEVVKAQLASRRQGTQAAKNRSAVSGSTKKLYKQKGTGRARHGSIRAPVYVGGGRAHPPRPRDWSYRPPQQVRSSALRSALSKLHKEGRLVVVDRLELPEVKTKGLVTALDTLQKVQKDRSRRARSSWTTRRTRSFACRSVTARTISFCRRKGSTCTTSSATTPSSSPRTP